MAKRKSVVLLVIGLLLGAGLAWKYIGRPAYDDRASAQASLAVLRADADKLLLTPSEQDALRAALPPEVDRKEIQRAVDMAAEASGVVLTDISVTPWARTGNGIRAATVRITCLGTPATVAALVNRLESSLTVRPGTKFAYASSPDPALTVTGIDARALPGGKRVRATLVATAYRYIPSR